MSLIHNRTSSNYFLLALKKSFIFIIKHIIVFFLIISCITFIVGSSSFAKRLTLQFSGYTYDLTAKAVLYITETVYYPLETIKKNWLRDSNNEYQDQKMKIQYLINENESLKNDNYRLQNLLKFVSDFQFESVSSRFINSDPKEEYGIVACGKNCGVNVGDTVVSEKGLIGKLVYVSANYSKIMLITNKQFRIPVQVSSGQKGILIGGKKVNKLLYINSSDTINNNLTPGSIVSTSNNYNIPGIPVAQINYIDDGYIEAKPIADLTKTNFISILKNIELKN